MAESFSFCRVSPENTCYRLLLQTANLLAILKSPFWCLSNVMYIRRSHLQDYECNNNSPISIVLYSTLNPCTEFNVQ